MKGNNTYKIIDILHFTSFLLLFFMIAAFDNREGAEYIQWVFVPFVLLSLFRLRVIWLSKEYILLLFFVIWSMTTVLWTIATDDSYVRFFTVLLLSVLFFTVTEVSFVSKTKRFDMIFISMILGTLYVSYLMRNEFESVSLLNLITDSLRIKEEEIANVNAIGKAASISLVFCLYKVLNDNAKWYFLLIAVFVGILLVTKSKSAQLSIILAGSFLILRKVRWRKRKVRNLFIISLVCVILYFVIISGILGNAFARLVDMFEFFQTGDVKVDESTAERVDFISKGLQMFSENPFFGYGMGCSNRVLHGTYFHNNYVQLVVETGLIGLCLYYGFLYVIISRLWKDRKNDMSNFFLALFIIILFCDLTNTTYYHKINYLIYALAVSYLNNRKLLLKSFLKRK